MEDALPIIIPTLSRAKISSRLTYPIGAEKLSLGLASTKQLVDLKLHFYSWSDRDLKRGRYEFMRVEYLNNAKSAVQWLISNLFKRPPQYRWEIIVQPVPRTLRRRINGYILDLAIPLFVAWLGRRANPAVRGAISLRFPMTK